MMPCIQNHLINNWLFIRELLVKRFHAQLDYTPRISLHNRDEGSVPGDSQRNVPDSGT